MAGDRQLCSKSILGVRRLRMKAWLVSALFGFLIRAVSSQLTTWDNQVSDEPRLSLSLLHAHPSTASSSTLDGLPPFSLCRPLLTRTPPQESI